MVTSTNNGLKIYMCGRFTLEPTTKLFERFKIDNRVDGLKARYNIAPTQDVPAICVMLPFESEGGEIAPPVA